MGLVKRLYRTRLILWEGQAGSITIPLVLQPREEWETKQGLNLKKGCKYGTRSPFKLRYLTILLILLQCSAPAKPTDKADTHASEQKSAGGRDLAWRRR